MAALVELTKRWPLKPDAPGVFHPLFGATHRVHSSPLLFFYADHSTFVVMSTRPSNHMLPSRCVDI